MCKNEKLGLKNCDGSEYLEPSQIFIFMRMEILFMSGNTVTFKLRGRIDSDSSAAVRAELFRELEGKRQDCVVLDAEELTYISSAGLRLLLQLMKECPHISMINVSSDVYEIMEMTGITEMMTVEKAFRRLSVDGCEVIGEGANGKVYRIDRETVVKIYKNADALPDIRHEQEVARLALILGIPTAISYDVVRVGDSYGSVFELLDAMPFSKILAEQPEKMDWCVRKCVDLLKRIHSTRVPAGRLPDMKVRASGWISGMKSCLPGNLGEKLQRMVDAVPDCDTMIHGDYHTNNIVFSGGEVLLIDMDTLSCGHPVFELAQMYCSFVGFAEYDTAKVEGFLGISLDMARAFWRKCLQAYLNIGDENLVIKAENAVRCLAYGRLIDWSMRHRGEGDEETWAERALWLKELTGLLDQVDSLLVSEAIKEGMTVGMPSEIPVQIQEGISEEIPERISEEKQEDKAVENPDDISKEGESFAGLREQNRPKGIYSVYLSVLNDKNVHISDLHMHSTCSDGTDTPNELIARVRDKGIPLFSLTDHDSISGCSMIRDSLQDQDPHFVAGVEFSCKDENGEYHILGYGYNLDSPHIKRLTVFSHQNRMKKVHMRIDYLKEKFGISFPENEISKLFSLDNPGKPHIGNLMVKYGFAPTKDLAIETFLNHMKLPSQHLAPDKAIIGILASGGIPVLAHPVFGSGKELITGDELVKRIERLMEYGLKGVESFYSGFSDEQTAEVLSIAGKHNLYVTAGSDYHGKNKKVPLGDNGMQAYADLPEGFIRFLKDVRFIH